MGIKRILEEDYELVRKIGEGSSGIVLHARRRQDGRDVAVKVIKRGVVMTTTSASIEAECEVLKLVHSERVVELIDVREDDAYTCLVTEYVPGKNLYKQLSRRDEGLTELEALRVLEGVLDALVYLHARGIAHRDIKLENIMLAGNDCAKVKLVDFGLAHRTVDAHANGLCTRMCGTPQYLTPQIVAGTPYEPQMVDMWCVGVVLYALIERSLPFRSRTRKQLFDKIANEQVRLDGPAWTDVSDGTKGLVRALLSKDPAGRPCAQQCLDAVREIMGSTAPAAPEVKEEGVRQTSPAIGSPMSGGSPRPPSSPVHVGGLFGMLMDKFTGAHQTYIAAS